MGDLAYVLGHSDRELERLGLQERLIGAVTRRFFREAGIGDGQRVLDVGSGAGDVAFLAAELVGETGEVIGTDRAPAAVAAATKRAQAKGMRNVSFCLGDPTAMAFDRPFDAVVGRYVLVFQPDLAASVRKLAAHLRSGGVITFHEPDLRSLRSIPPAPTYDRCCHWVYETFRLVGTEVIWQSGFIVGSLKQACRHRLCECRPSSAGARAVPIGCKDSAHWHRA